MFNFLFRFYSFLVLIISLILLIFGFGLFENEVYAAIDLLYSSLKAQLIYIGILLIFILLSLYFLLQHRGSKESTETINQKNELGETRVTITAMENIAAKVLQRIPGVKDWKIRLRSSEVDGHQFYIKVIADGEHSIPQLTEQIQNEVKQKVEEISGIPIHSVSVLISDIGTVQPQKSRRVE